MPSIAGELNTSNLNSNYEISFRNDPITGIRISLSGASGRRKPSHVALFWCLNNIFYLDDQKNAKDFISAFISGLIPGVYFIMDILRPLTEFGNFPCVTFFFEQACLCHKYFVGGLRLIL